MSYYYGKRTCPTCQKRVRLRKDGSLYSHWITVTVLKSTSSAVAEGSFSTRCAGEGEAETGEVPS